MPVAAEARRLRLLLLQPERVRAPETAAAIEALAAEGKMSAKDVARAVKQYRIDSEKPNPIGV